MSWFTNIFKLPESPPSYALLASKPGVGKKNEVSSVDLAVAQSSPTMKTRQHGSNPIELMGEGSNKDLPSWLELAPTDIRLRVLTQLTQQQAPAAVQADLANYAQASKATSNDVKEFHRHWRDPRASLLASRNLVKCAWDAAKATGWSEREQGFYSIIRSSASDFSAVILDGRLGVEYEDYLPVALSALMESNVQHLHLRLGYTSAPRLNTSFWNIGSTDLSASLNAWIEASKKRLASGRPLPSVFLSMSGGTVKQLAATLKASPVSLNIVGLSLCGNPHSLKIGQQKKETVDEMLGSISHEDAQLEDWNALFAQLKDIRYLNLSGWAGKGLSDALVAWFGPQSSLAELHLPMCHVTVPCLVHIVTTIQAKTSFKCLAIDLLTFEHVPGYTGGASLSRAMKNNPDLMVITRTDSPVLEKSNELERYWLAGRYLINPLPSPIRALPEIYGQVDFFQPATS